MRNERGFSLLIVIFVLIVMSVVGVTAATISSSDAGSAGARSARSHALLAAETGMALVTASGDATIVEGIIHAKDGTITALPVLDLDGNGTAEHEPAYRVIERNEGAFIIEGLLRDQNDRVISRAMLGGRVAALLGGDGYEGQTGLDPRSTGVSDETGMNQVTAERPL